MEKQSLYDELCKALTWFEHPQEAEDVDVTQNLYEVAVKVQNEWENLIS